MDMFSVVIPAYNRANTIERAINSVLHQTYQDFEVIVVDDGSKDNTAEIVRDLASKDHRIRYIHQENQGAQVARNRGIMEAQYEWIAFLDSDDEWLPKKLELQFAILQQNQFAPMLVVHGDCIVKDILNAREERWNFSKLVGKDVYARVLATGGTMFQGMITSKIALEMIGFLDAEVVAYQEWDTSIALAKFCKYVAAEEPVFVYYLHEGETISKDHVRDVEGYYFIIQKWKEDILLHCGIAGWNHHLNLLCERCIHFGFFERADFFYYERYGRSMKVRDFVNSVKNMMQRVEAVYCYGAGVTGRLVKLFFDCIGVQIRCFVVSPGQPTGIHEGIPIRSIDCINDVSHGLIVISTRENFHEEIQETVKLFGGNNIYPVTDEVYLLMNAFLKFRKGEAYNERGQV